MNPAILSLIALLIAIALSMATKLNVGVAAMAFAWLIGTFAAGWKAEQVAAGFPSSLFLTLTGVTLLFALAETNGTLERLAHRAVGLARGQARLLPMLLFGVAFALSSIGPGAIIAVALLIPMAMAAATRAGVPRFLTALAVANGANAGNLSPISAIGIVANTKMAEAGLGGHEAEGLDRQLRRAPAGDGGGLRRPRRLAASQRVARHGCRRGAARSSPATG